LLLNWLSINRGRDPNALSGTLILGPSGNIGTALLVGTPADVGTSLLEKGNVGTIYLGT
jgi:hypothetical protein